ncbi:MAG: hypothetical protein KAT00_14075, partial [Planctomycetes bacterium]|nr:hypothetical protein [Planctomycetota bacterium]
RLLRHALGRVRQSFMSQASLRAVSVYTLTIRFDWFRLSGVCLGGLRAVGIGGAEGLGFIQPRSAAIRACPELVERGRLFGAVFS